MRLDTPANALPIPTDVPVCLSDTFSRFVSDRITTDAYDILNSLHKERMKLLYNNGRILFRLLMMNQKLLDKRDNERLQRNYRKNITGVTTAPVKTI
jgi:hypothetical protein